MAYIFMHQSTGFQPIATSSATLSTAHPLGTIAQAYDPDYGAGEFIYLKGVASTVVGSWVHYNLDDWTTTLMTAGGIGPLAVAMSANDTATEYGWYQISGKAVGKSADVADSAVLYIDTVPGQPDDAAVAGDMIFNAKSASEDDTSGNAHFRLSRPFTTGEIDT